MSLGPPSYNFYYRHLAKVKGQLLTFKLLTPAWTAE